MYPILLLMISIYDYADNKKLSIKRQFYSSLEIHQIYNTQI